MAELSPTPDDAQDRHIARRFRLVERIGLGSVGEVYRAEDLALGRVVALKLLSPGWASQSALRDALLSEARAAAAFSHPNLATLYEVALEASPPFIVMELVPGETIAKKLEGGPLTVAMAVDVAAQIAAGLSEIHRQKYVHGDLSSRNVVVTPDGHVKVLDFGLARLSAEVSREASSGGDQASLPSEGASPTGGTLGYVSPERLTGSACGACGDLFALGVILFEMLTGRRPFSADDPADVHPVLVKEAPPLSLYRSDVPLELERVIRRTLQKDPECRCSSADALLLDLKGIRLGLDGPTDRMSARAGAESLARTASCAPVRTESPWLRPTALWTMLAAIALLAAVGQPTRYGTWSWHVLWLGVVPVALLVRARARRRDIGAANLLPEIAFRGLLPFQEADRDRFFGRGLDVAALLEKTTAQDMRFLVLFGDSGTGKTSLLKAGLIPRLWEAGLLPLYVRSYGDPLAALVNECERRSRLVLAPDESIPGFLARIAQAECAELVLVFDQFEEFFVRRRSRAEREPFVAFSADCQGRSDLPVRILLSIRSDFLYLVGSEFEDAVPDPLRSARLHHLRFFDRDQAIGVIEDCARRAQLGLEPGLPQHVAGDLAVGGVVLPCELQIVGQGLQAKRILTTAEYRRAGGKEALVHGFLDDIVRTSGHAESAWLVLRSFISDVNTRLTLPLQEVVHRVHLPRSRVEALLRRFVDARLVREIQDEEPWRYELMHEYLIARINQATGRVVDATQRANRLFRQYLSSHAVDRKTHIPLSQAVFIARHADVERGEAERRLLRASLRRGLSRLALLSLAVVTLVVGLVAALSVREEWDGRRLSDGHSENVRKIAFSPDGRRLVSIGGDGLAIVWDFARRARIATLKADTRRLFSLAYSADGRFIATAGEDSKIVIWDAATLAQKTVLRGHKAGVTALGFSPDGRLLASSSDYGDVKTVVWRVADGAPALQLAGVAPGEVGAFHFLPHDRLRIGLGLHDLRSGRPITSPFAGEGANAVATSPDGARLLAVDGAGRVSLFDAITGRALARERPHRDHGRAVAFSPDGRYAASGADDIVLWDAGSLAKLARFGYPSIVWSLAFSRDGRFLVSSHADGAILLWDVAERQRVGNLNEHAAAVERLSFSGDGRLLASASVDGSIILWDVTRGSKRGVLLGHATAVNAVAFAADGRSLASCDQDAGLILWDPESLTARARVAPPTPTNCYTLAVSPSGEWVATSSGVYDTFNARWLVEFRDSNTVYALAFSPTGDELAVTSWAGRVLVYDTRSWQVAEHWAGESERPRRVAFSPDGARLVTGDNYGRISLWNVHPLKPLGLLGKHTGQITGVAFRPGGHQVLSSSADRTVALWGVASRRLAARIATETSPVTALALSPDGRRLATGVNESVRLYEWHRSLWGHRLERPTTP